MSVRFKTLYLVITFFALLLCTSWAQVGWEFNKRYETQALIKTPFFLNAVADLNKNGKKELIVADFGKYGDHVEEWKTWRKDWDRWNLFVLEWHNNELKVNFKKQWDLSKIKGGDHERQQYFMAFDAKQMLSWALGDRVIVETMPPYLGLEWEKGNYLLREQQGSAQKGPKVGSWIFPWLSVDCYENFTWPITWPNECLGGIRDFSGKGEPKIVTILEEKINDKQYKQTIRVRRFGPGFPIEWEMTSPMRFMFELHDWLTLKKTSGLVMREVRNPILRLFVPSEKGGYELKPLKDKLYIGNKVKDLYEDYPITEFDLPDILRSTKTTGVEEYWGFRRVDIPNPGINDFMMLLRKMMIKPDLSGFTIEDVDFPHHDSFLSVGFFDLKDIDGDGLDEVILVEETGKKHLGGETFYYSHIKDYIHILKWNGKEYQTMWVSPPYTKRGTKFLVDDIKNTGKKQLVVLSPYGTVQIWEKE